MKVITLYKNWADVVQWLQTNVGPLLHSQPINFWHGTGWHMKSSYTSKNVWAWEVDIDNDHVALLFMVRFG